MRIRSLIVTATLIAFLAAAPTFATILAQTGFEPGDTWYGASGPTWFAETEPSKVFTGNYALRATYRAYTDHEAAGSLDFSEPQEEVYARFYQKNSSNWMWSPIATKCASINLYDCSPLCHPFYVDIFHDGNPAPRGSVPMILLSNGIPDVPTFSMRQQNVGTTVVLANDRWYCLEAHVKLNTPGMTNGVLEGWIDGELKYSYSGLNIRGDDTRGLNRFRWRTYWNNQSTSLSQTIHRWVDDIVVSTAYVGPVGIADETAPTVGINVPTAADKYTTDQSNVTLAGTADDSFGVVGVTYTNRATGVTGTASGTANWSVTTIALQLGENVVVAAARDDAGNVGTDAITITYDPSGPGDTTPPSLVSALPADGTTGVPRNANISFHLLDEDAGVDESSIAITVDGANVTPTNVEGDPDDLFVTYNPPTDFAAYATVTVSVAASDLAGNAMATVSWSFICGPEADTTPPPVPTGLRIIATSDGVAVLSWDAVTASDLAGYRVLYDGGARVVEAGPGTTLAVEGLDGAAAYTFTVRSYDTAGNESADSESVTALASGYDTGRDAFFFPNVVRRGHRVTVVAADAGTVVVHDLSGKIVASLDMSEGEVLPWLPAGLVEGVYIVRVPGAEATRKLLVQR